MFKCYAVFHFSLQIDKANIIERYNHYVNYNTNLTYLMFLAYLFFTVFEILSMYCCCRPRLTSLFPKKARQQVDLPREDSQR